MLWHVRQRLVGLLPRPMFPCTSFYPASMQPTKTSNNIMLDISDGENPIQIVLDKPVTNPLAEKVG